jgi:hypothetical protein
MVLEHLFPENWLEKKVRYAFIIAVVYATVGIIVARLLFGANSGIVSVIFTSLLLLPYLQKMFVKEEREEEHEKKYSLARFTSLRLFFKKNQAIRVYLAIFFGIYFTYMAYSFILPQLGLNTFNIFKEQLFIDPALRGRAYDMSAFFSILVNNWWVLLACFLLSIVSGDGAIFFITWNASSWGTIFGYRALSAAMYSGESALLYLGAVLLITFPHVLLEGLSYILAAISGNVISDEIIKAKKDIRKFIVYLVFGMGLMFLLSFIFRAVGWSSLMFGFVSIAIITPILFIIGRLFHQKRLKKVFLENYDLFILAIVIFIIGALVETFVITNSGMLSTIYALSRIGG